MRSPLTLFYVSSDDPGLIRDDNGYVLCETDGPVPANGTYVRITGAWNVRRFHVCTLRIRTCNRKESLALVKGAITSVRRKYPKIRIPRNVASLIMSVIGEDAVEYVRTHKNEVELTERIPQLNIENAYLIYTELRTQIESTELVPYFNKVGIPIQKAYSASSLLGPGGLRSLKKKPYSKGFEIGLNFYECERIAEEEAYSPTNNERICSAAYTALRNYFETTGSTYCDFALLCKKTLRVLRKGVLGTEYLPETFTYVMLEKDRRFFFFTENEKLKVTLRSVRRQEETIVKAIRALNINKINNEYADSFIREIEEELHVTYNAEQLEVLRAMRTCGIFVLTGGPGTGKTTVIAGMIRIYQKIGRNRIFLCAPTGRASGRMKEACNYPACTIHSLLGIRIGDIQPTHNPLPADLLIVDEFSMVDTELCSLLFSAIRRGTSVVLVGDPWQLRSVGPGNVLSDIINSGCVRVYTLSQVLRQDKESFIIASNAEKIRNGHYDLDTNENFQIIRCRTKEEGVRTVLDLFAQKYDPEKPFKLQFMDPLRRGENGTVVLNRTAEKEILKKDANARYVPGDRVIFLRNNPNKGYFNGDLGIVKKADPSALEIQVLKDRIILEREFYDDITLSYFITVHKAQGSEFDECVIFIPERPRVLMTRNLIFTAITRGKKRTVIVSINDSLENCLRTPPPNVQTGLKLLLDHD